mmetsp:Transcript_29792/g.58454  ORF Transcript_29792/g.58454 Transcript_29792/m.58454 type:complete len:364 (-) Transcript_29792:200-1291(-)
MLYIYNRPPVSLPLPHAGCLYIIHSHHFRTENVLGQAVLEEVGQLRNSVEEFRVHRRGVSGPRVGRHKRPLIRIHNLLGVLSNVLEECEALLTSLEELLPVHIDVLPRLLRPLPCPLNPLLGLHRHEGSAAETRLDDDHFHSEALHLLPQCLAVRLHGKFGGAVGSEAEPREVAPHRGHVHNPTLCPSDQLEKVVVHCHSSDEVNLHRPSNSLWSCHVCKERVGHACVVHYCVQTLGALGLHFPRRRNDLVFLCHVTDQSRQCSRRFGLELCCRLLTQTTSEDTETEHVQSLCQHVTEPCVTSSDEHSLSPRALDRKHRTDPVSVVPYCCENGRSGDGDLGPPFLFPPPVQESTDGRKALKSC